MNDSKRLIRLIKSAKKGNVDSFELLYQFYFVPIFRYIYFRVRDKELAEDLLQTTFLKIYQRISNIKIKGKSPSAYFFTVARNTIIDYWRQNKRIVFNDSDEIFNEIPDAKADPQKSIKNQEASNLIKQALQQLTEEQQEIIVLKFINEMSNREIAALLCKSEEAIRQLQCRALKILRQYFKTSKLI